MDSSSETSADQIIGVVSATEEHPERFYVVSLKKLSILFVATFGLYLLWWVYRNWSTYKARSNDKDLWPAARAFFPIFFSHSLNRVIDSTLNRRNIQHEWDPNLLATVFVVGQIAMNLFFRMSAKEIGAPWTDLLGIVSSVVVLFSILATQSAINAACYQPLAESNKKFSWANWIWIVLGGIFWALVLIDTFLTVTD